MTIRIREIRTLLVLALGGSAAACAAASTPGYAPGADEVRRIAYGETLAGSLADSDPRIEDGSHYDLYAFDGDAGDHVEITLRSDDFDAYVALVQQAGGELKVLESDDDGAGGTNAQITTELPRSGRYVIRANSLAEGETGDYRVQLRLAPRATRTPVRAGETLSGDLSESDAVLPGGSPYDFWILEGSENEVIQIDLMSDDFDPYLAFGSEEGGEFEMIDSNDDGGDGLNARLYATLPGTGRYVARASAVGRQSSGPYRIRVTSLGQARPATREPIALDHTRDGTLASTDGRLTDGGFHDLWTFAGTAGQRVEIDLSSDDFDAYLEVGTEADGTFRVLESNDDGGPGRDARIRFTPPETGDYVIRVKAFSRDGMGDYTLRLGTPAPERPVTREPIRLDEPRDGSLIDSDARLDNDAHHDLWIYDGRAGETVTIELVSEDFDTFIALGYEVDGRFQQLETNDDGGDGTDSRLVATLDEARPYVIRATSYSGDQTGEYRITVSPGR